MKINMRNITIALIIVFAVSILPIGPVFEFFLNGGLAPFALYLISRYIMYGVLGCILGEWAAMKLFKENL